MSQDGDGTCTTPVPAGSKYWPFTMVLSKDKGRSWSEPKPIPGAGCVRPRLLQLPNNGPLLLSGGRLCTENVTDAFVWSLDRADATHQKWKKHSLSYEHNSLWEGDRNLRFSGRYVNDSDVTGKVRPL